MLPKLEDGFPSFACQRVCFGAIIPRYVIGLRGEFGSVVSNPSGQGVAGGLSAELGEDLLAEVSNGLIVTSV